MNRKHKNYITNKQREKRKLDQALADKESELRLAKQSNVSKDKLDQLHSDLGKLQTKYDQAVSLMPPPDEAALARKTHPVNLYKLIIKLARDALAKAKLAHSDAPLPSCAEFQFLNEHDMWVDILADEIIQELKKLSGGVGVTVQYKGSNAQMYEVRHNDTGSSDYEYIQKNVSYGTERPVRISALHTTAAAAAASSSSVPSDRAIQILFGHENIIELPSKDEIEAWQTGHRFDMPQMTEICDELAELATEWSALSCNFKYTHPSDCKTELWVKPILLSNWLTMAVNRGYTHARLGMHGSSNAGYDNMRTDPMCYNMKLAGKNGMAHGNGIYMGLSDQVSVGYNKRGGDNTYKDGTAILNLILCDKNLNQKHNGGFTPQENREEYDKCASTFGLGVGSAGGPSAMKFNGNNCVVAHEMYLVLPLGLCVSL